VRDGLAVNVALARTEAEESAAAETISRVTLFLAIEVEVGVL
jgi:hypothetical protein